MKVPQYLTQIKRADWDEIARAANVESGRGLKINRETNRLTIQIDESEFKRMVWYFLHNGGQSAAVGDLDDVPLN